MMWEQTHYPLKKKSRALRTVNKVILAAFWGKVFFKYYKQYSKAKLTKKKNHRIFLLWQQTNHSYKNRKLI